MNTFEREYHRLNPAQKQAVDTIDGPLLVIAGPGTGKTQLLAVRVANILKKTDVDPANILCLTFTEAAARNMRERLGDIIGEAAYRVGIFTFHGFGTDIIRRYPEYFEEEPLVKAVDELGAYELLRNLFASLKHRNPLSLQIGDDFLHLNSTRTAISWLKRAGITPDRLQAIIRGNRAFMNYAEPLLQSVFSDRPAAEFAPQYLRLLQNLRDYQSVEADSSLAELCTTELAQAIEQLEPKVRHAKSITTWRNTWLKQDVFKHWIFSDRRKTNLLKALADLYRDFQKLLAERGLYTFDDMILRSLRALELHEELRLSLQEQYQFILVDEYQDTNGAQNDLLNLIAENPINEGRPNLMVVGDDDQAIYRFQGANLSIMLDFLKRWRSVKQVVLTDNYRSGPDLLKAARSVVRQGQERLENSVPQLSKELVSAQPRLATRIFRWQAPTELDECTFVADTIEQLVKNGARPESIAVLAPKHSFLQKLVPFLGDKHLPVSYERREHILGEPHIEALLQFAELIVALAAGNWADANAKLPVVLAAPYWNISAHDLWNISLEAYQRKLTWLELLAKHHKPIFRSLYRALQSLAKNSLNVPLEAMLDQLTGNSAVTLDNHTTWLSPYRQYYFNEQLLTDNPSDYVKLIGQLATLRAALREYRPDQHLKLQDLVAFGELYQRSGLTLLDTNPHSTNAEAIELMTAYKAKGLEWPIVFVLGCHEEVWGSKARLSNYSFGLPRNLLWIKPARDSNDDRLRLFYVAITRAQQQLYLLSYQQTETGRKSEPLGWLVNSGDALPKLHELPTQTTAQVVRAHEVSWQTASIGDRSLQRALQPFLETYQLSPTHLNDFLDITKGGPRNFFNRHILHFPESLQPSAIFGSAMHATLHSIHAYMNRHHKLPAQTVIAKIFTDALDTSPLGAQVGQHLLERGTEALKAFVKAQPKAFLPNDKSEYGFKNEGVHLGEARLTGTIDVLRQLGQSQYAIIDYKTGRPMESWRPVGAFPQIRAHLYQQQLLFYKFLVEHATHLKQNIKVTKTSLQFVEPSEDGVFIDLDLPTEIANSQRLEALIQVIWQHIMKLDFPDTSHYNLTLKGVVTFEDDLLSGHI